MTQKPASIESCELKMVHPDNVAAVRRSLPEPKEVSDLAEVFSLLGDPGRLRLLMSLLEGSEMCVCDLAATTAMSESSVSHALRLLRAHRVVSVTRRGRMAYYRLNDGHVRMLLDLGLTHIGHTVAIHPETTGLNQ